MISKLRAALAIPVLVVMLAGCGVGGSGEDAMPSSASAGSSSAGEASDGPADALRTDAKEAVTTPLNRAVISTGQIYLQSSSITKARSEVMRLVTSWNATVADEQTNSDDHGRVVDSTMTLRVPTATFSEAMNALGQLGEVSQQKRKSEDVTTRVIDNGARVRAAERSIKQIEMLLGRAEKLGDIIAIESDLARRQADLDSLKSQEAWLADQTSLSTITVYLERHSDVSPGKDEARGFLVGLARGWNAMQDSTLLLLTILGAALPFAVLVGLLGVPLWLVVRRRLSAASAPAQSP